jgi:hypothetical protein
MQAQSSSQRLLLDRTVGDGREEAEFNRAQQRLRTPEAETELQNVIGSERRR